MCSSSLLLILISLSVHVISIKSSPLAHTSVWSHVSPPALSSASSFSSSSLACQYTLGLRVFGDTARLTVSMLGAVALGVFHVNQKNASVWPEMSSIHPKLCIRYVWDNTSNGTQAEIKAAIQTLKQDIQWTIPIPIPNNMTTADNNSTQPTQIKATQTHAVIGDFSKKGNAANLENTHQLIYRHVNTRKKGGLHFIEYNRAILSVRV